MATFEQRLTDAGAATDPAAALAALTEARSLYRGEYLDDCPFYGDGAYVEDRRELLRARYVDLLLAIGGFHEQRGDRGAAAAAFREARLAADDECPAGRCRAGAPRLRLGSRPRFPSSWGRAARIASAWRRLVWSSSRRRAMLIGPRIPSIRAWSADHTSAG